MNLALQKRHEQLERWRQNEANAELQKQQAIESKKLQEQNQNTSNNQSDDSTKNTYFKSKSVQNNISPFDDQVLGGENISNNETKFRTGATTSSSSKPSRFLSSKQQPQQARPQVKFTNSTLFLNACANGDLDECKRLLDNRLVDINVTTCDGLTGLHEAAICGNSEMVEYLIDNGANINCCDNEGWTPLHAAASLGQTDIVELLLKYQADATIVNCENFLAYDLARNDVVRELIGNHLEGHDIDKLRRQEELMIEQDIEKWIRTGQYEEKFHPATQATVLHVLAAKGYVKLMKRMLETSSLKKQINLEAKDNEGFTPLLAGSFWNQTEIVELLIEHGANIFAQSNSGYKISSIHLKNYQQSKSNQPQPIRPGAKSTHLSSQSIDSDNASLDNSENYSRATTRSTTSLDSSAATGDDYDDSSIGDNIPSGSARHLRQQQQQQQQHGSLLTKSKSLEISSSNKIGLDDNQESPILFSTMSVDRLLLRADSMGERDLRKSFKELVMENERLKQQLKGFDDKDKQRQQEWIRKERQMHRKISELEEENKLIEHWKQEIQRLKDENNSLIRVVSKLSKQP